MIPPLWVRLTMNLLLVLRTLGAATALYKQNEPAIRRALSRLRRGASSTTIRRRRDRAS